MRAYHEDFRCVYVRNLGTRRKQTVLSFDASYRQFPVVGSLLPSVRWPIRVHFLRWRVVRSVSKQAPNLTILGYVKHLLDVQVRQCIRSIVFTQLHLQQDQATLNLSQFKFVTQVYKIVELV